MRIGQIWGRVGTGGRAVTGDGGVTCIGTSCRMSAGMGAGSGLVVMKRVAAERSGRGGGVCVRLGFVGLRGSFFTQRFRGPTRRFILVKSSINSSRSIVGRRFIDLAGWRIHTGAENVFFPSFTGKGSYPQIGG
jgi:hypothetical protein